ncbi:MAG: ABC transporter permease [Gemmatimonadota bacterium]|nr:ABC transporter permease [Gemmatimonadota bacterium]
MSAGSSRSARLARAIVARTVWDSEAQDAVSNLDDIYERKLESRGRLAADAWYWVQALTFGPRLWLTPGGRMRSAGVRDRSALSVWLDALRVDARFALRGLRRSPGFAAAAVATLAVGIAATTVTFAVVEGVVLRPPPFPEPDRLVWAWPGGELALTHERYLQIERSVGSADLTAFATRTFALQGADRPDEVVGMAVSADHFSVMGRSPALGRAFIASDGAPGGETVALIGHELWTTHFGADPSVVGRRVDLYTSAAIPMIQGAFTGTPHTVIGVLPPGYRPFGFAVDVVTPLVADPAESSFASMGELTMVGRLTEGATAGGLRSELVSVTGREPGFESMEEDIATAEVVSLHTALTGHVRPVVLAMFGAVALVLLIACANVANLVLARTSSRRGELGVRAALGAGRGRIGRQLVTECGLLAAFATAFGVGLAAFLLPAVVRRLPHELGLAADAIRIRPSVLIVAAAVIGLVLLIAGVLPALRGTQRLAESVAGRRGRIGSSRGEGRSYRGLIVSELALALVLVSGAGLLIKSLSHLMTIDPGFSPGGVMTARVAPSAEEYADTELRRALFGRVLDEVRALPGVEAAGAIHFLPIADGGPGLNFLVDPADPESRASTGYRVVTPEYFDAMRIEIVEGRDVSGTDGPASSPVGLVNRALATRLWPGESAVGRRLYRTSGDEWFTVVGVTADVRQGALGVAPEPEAYVPLAQTGWASAMTIVLRASELAPELARSVERIIWSVDPDVPITRTASMEELVRASIASPRFYGLLFTLFAGIALVLGAIGVYGVVSFGVRQRTDEIGIRMALGATGSRILRREMASAARLSSAGVVLGLVGAALASRALGSLLFDVSPLDPLVFGAAAAVLVGVALAAAWLPAVRASRVDPLTTIRGD